LIPVETIVSTKKAQTRHRADRSVPLASRRPLDVQVDFVLQFVGIAELNLCFLARRTRCVRQNEPDGSNCGTITSAKSANRFPPLKLLSTAGVTGVVSAAVPQRGIDRMSGPWKRSITFQRSWIG